MRSVPDYMAFDPAAKKRKRRHKTFPTQRLAKAWWEENVKDIRAKVHVPNSQSITVADMAKRWIAAVTQGRGERALLKRQLSDSTTTMPTVTSYRASE